MDWKSLDGIAVELGLISVDDEQLEFGKNTVL